MITRERWDRLHSETLDKAADEIEADCIIPQLQKGEVQVVRGGRAVVASFSASSLSAGVINVLHDRGKAAGWKTWVDPRSGWFELYIDA